VYYKYSGINVKYTWKTSMHQSKIKANLEVRDHYNSYHILSSLQLNSSHVYMNRNDQKVSGSYL